MYAFHLTDSNDPDIHVIDGLMLAHKKTQNQTNKKKNTTPHPTCTIHENKMWLQMWLNAENMCKILIKMVNPRDLTGNMEKEETSSSLGV